jgi:PhoPQ-activated pathogenicity-related protein
MNTLSAFARAQIHDKPMPELSWKHDDNGGKLRLTVKTNVEPVAARLWVAQAPTKDFRKATWVEQPAAVKEGTVVGEVAPPTDGCMAFFGELEFVMDGLKYCLSTQVRVVESGK